MNVVKIVYWEDEGAWIGYLQDYPDYWTQGQTIEGFGCILVRRGGKHDWYRNPKTGVSQPVPRHREIKEHLARHIIKMLQSNSG